MRFRYGLPFLLFSLLSLSVSGTEWYSSAPNGVPGAPLYIGKAAETGWSLSIEFEENRELRSLYLDGKPQSVTVLIRSDGRLVAREQLNADGVLESRVEYAYDAEGNPRAAVIQNAASLENENERRVELSSRIAADGESWRQSGGSGDDWVVSDLDQAGRPIRRKVVQGGVVTSETVLDRNQDGRVSEERTVNGDELRRRIYDNEGRLVEEINSYAGATTLVRVYTWKGQDLVRVEERGQGRLSVREMIWNNGRMEEEIRFVDGVKVLETEWKSGDERVETLYRDGEAIIRVYWNGTVRQREEFLRNGTVVRVKEAVE